jgi:FkbM family methyltransferase
MQTRTRATPADPPGQLLSAGPREAVVNDEIKQLGRRAVRAAAAVDPLREALRRGAQLGVVPGPIWKRTPVEADFEVRFPEGAHFRYLSSAYDGIGRQLYFKGVTWWEYETTALFGRLAARASLTLDIGANTGFYTLLAAAANPAGRVIAFEPVPRIYGRLCDNIELNGWDHRCDARQQAVSRAAGEMTLHVPDQEIPTSASLNPEGYRGQSGKQVPVQVTTMDAAVPEGDRVDLIKIDVEGYEHDALAGGERVLSRDQPLIVLEVNPGGPAAQIEAILKPLGYRFQHLRPEGPRPVDSIAPDPAVHWRNFLCVPPAKTDWL